METKIETALAGVSNFREFQTEARDFFSRYDEREKQRDRRTTLFVSLATLVFLGITAAAGMLAWHAAKNHALLDTFSTSDYQYTLAERTTK